MRPSSMPPDWSTTFGTAPGSPDSNTPTWPSRSTANQSVSMLCAAGKSGLEGNVVVIDPSTEGHAEIRERRRQRRMGQRRQRTPLARVRAPGDRLVPCNGAEARALAAHHEAGHRLEPVAARD